MSTTTPHPSDCDCLVCLTDMTQSREKGNSGPTPGPWHRGLRRAAGRIEIKNAAGNLIAMVNGWPEAEDNVRLICAASDMRDALCKFVTAAKSWHDFHHGSETIQCDWLCECIAAGEAALAKAVRS